MEKVFPTRTATLDDLYVNNVRKGRVDSLVLEYMARKLALTALTVESASIEHVPAVFSLTERRSRTHRLMLFDPALLMQDTPLLYVGFVSEYRAAMTPQMSAELDGADQRMVSELLHIPGLVAYSSLALRDGSQHEHWYNFVIFQSTDTKTYLHHSSSHRHAAYTVAPQVYNWIRIHQGALAHGLAKISLQLQSTKHYVFANASQETLPCERVHMDAQVMMHELVY